MKLRAIDLFCGAGGFSAGAEATGGVELVCAVNHWRRAIETHATNFPHARHYEEPIQRVDPSDCDRCNILFASPDCTHFTKARGNRKKSKSSRCLAIHVLPWIEIHRPEWFVFENVHEFCKWGPLDSDGDVIKELEGGVFDGWIMMLRGYGYRVEYQRLNSRDFGAPTSRERLFIVGRRGKRNPVWPEPTGDIRSFESVLDTSLPMTDAIDRQKPICDTTLGHFRNAQKRFGDSTWIHGYYGNATFTPISEPLQTITCKDRFALVTASDGRFLTRMLSNRELQLAQGFPEEYRILGTRAEVTRQVGNSVSPAVAKAMTQAILSV